MGVGAARKARAICDNVENVVAIELLCAAQAQEFGGGLRCGVGAQAAYAALRARVPALDADRYLQPDLEAARRLVVSGELVAAVDRAVASPLEA